MSKEGKQGNYFLDDKLNESNVSSNLSSNSSRSSQSDDSNIMEVNEHNFTKTSEGLRDFIGKEKGIKAKLEGLEKEMEDIEKKTEFIRQAYIFCNSNGNYEKSINFGAMENTECKGIIIMASGLINRNNVLLKESQIKYVKLKIDIEKKKVLNNPKINNSLIELNSKLQELTEEMLNLNNEFEQLKSKDLARYKHGGKQKQTKRIENKKKKSNKTRKGINRIRSTISKRRWK